MKKLFVFALLFSLLLGCAAKSSAPQQAQSLDESPQEESTFFSDAVDFFTPEDLAGTAIFLLDIGLIVTGNDPIGDGLLSDD